MALVSGKSSTLNPNAPLCVPAVFIIKQRISLQSGGNYWIDQHQEEESFDGYVQSRDAVIFLLDSSIQALIMTFLESELEELVVYSETKVATETAFQKNGEKT